MKKFLTLFSALLLTAQLFAQIAPTSKIEIIASCAIDDNTAVFDLINRNPYSLTISYTSGESFKGDLYLEPNVDNQVMIYTYSLISFTYNSFLFKTMATNNNICGTPQNPYTNVFAYGIGRMGGINVVLVENKNNFDVTLQGFCGFGSKSFEVPANGQVYVIGDNSDFTFYYNTIPFVFIATYSYAIKEASFISVTPVCKEDTTATFEIQNNDSLSHDAILRNVSGTEHRYTLAAHADSTVTVENCNWDIYLAVPGWVDICNQLVDSTMMVGSVAPTNAQLTVSNNKVKIDADTCTQKITVSSDATWTVSSNQPWLTLNKSSGTGNGEFIFYASANTSGITRTATITITSRCTVQTVRVIQWVNPYNALAFDGIDDHVEIPDNDAGITNAFTLENWVKWQPSTSTDIQFVYAKGFEQMELHTGAGANGLRFIPTTGVYIDAANVLPVGIWTHVAAVYDPSQSLAKIYINGNEVPVVNHGSNPLNTGIVNTTTLFNIGRRSAGSYYFKGNIDELKVWNEVRSQTQIQQDMLNPITVFPQSNLIGYYDFNNGISAGDNTGDTTLTDLSGNYNGTLTGFALTGTTSNWVESYAMVIPTATTATSITSTGFTARWAPPAVGKVDTYLLEVAADSGFVNLLSGYDPLSTTDTFAVVSGLSPESTYYYRARADKASVTGEGAWSNTIQVVTHREVLVDLAVSDTTIVSGEACFDATNEITISTVTVEASASANFIAGYSVRFLPDFHAVSGSYMHALITEDASFCDVIEGSPIVGQTDVKSAEYQDTDENKASIPGEKSVKVYPNPNNGQFTLELTNFESGATVSIYNMLGAKVYQSAAKNEEVRKIDLPGIRKGIYFVRIVSGNSQITKKIIVK